MPFFVVAHAVSKRFISTDGGIGRIEESKNAVQTCCKIRVISMFVIFLSCQLWSTHHNSNTFKWDYSLDTRHQNLRSSLNGFWKWLFRIQRANRYFKQLWNVYNIMIFNLWMISMHFWQVVSCVSSKIITRIHASIDIYLVA